MQLQGCYPGLQVAWPGGSDVLLFFLIPDHIAKPPSTPSLTRIVYIRTGSR